MDKSGEYIKSINKHSVIHLALCVITSVLSVIFGLILEHWPLISTLTATSAITLVSGVIGLKLNSSTKKSLIKTFFIIQIILLCAWDFGGVVCVISVILGYKELPSGLFIAVCIACCISYIGFFIYFWVSFSVVNRLMITLNEKKRGLTFGVNKTYDDLPSKDFESTPTSRLLYTERQMRENTFKVALSP